MKISLNDESIYKPGHPTHHHWMNKRPLQPSPKPKGESSLRKIYCVSLLLSNLRAASSANTSHISNCKQLRAETSRGVDYDKNNVKGRGYLMLGGYSVGWINVSVADYNLVKGELLTEKVTKTVVRFSKNQTKWLSVKLMAASFQSLIIWNTIHLFGGL